MTIVGTLSAPFFARIFGKIKTVIIFQMLSVPFLFILSVTYNLPLVTNFSLEVVNENDRAFVSGILNITWFFAWGISASISGKIIETQVYFIP
ncbi:MAG: hypothetical protein ABDH49_06230 [Candidatus Hydrothermales bacterium]